MDALPSSFDRGTGGPAPPLANLRVSWGALLAGAVVMLTAAALLWLLCLAIVLSAAPMSGEGLRTAVIALVAVGWLATLLSAFGGGRLAGYLAGNPAKRIGGLHGLVTVCIAFLVTALLSLTTLGSLARSARRVALTPGSAALRGGSGLAGEKGRLAPRLVGEAQRPIGPSLAGEWRSRAVRDGRAEVAATKAQRYASGYTWITWGTWVLALALGHTGGAGGARSLARRPGRPEELARKEQAAPPPIAPAPAPGPA